MISVVNTVNYSLLSILLEITTGFMSCRQLIKAVRGHIMSDVMHHGCFTTGTLSTWLPLSMSSSWLRVLTYVFAAGTSMMPFAAAPLWQRDLSLVLVECFWREFCHRCLLRLDSSLISSLLACPCCRQLRTPWRLDSSLMLLECSWCFRFVQDWFMAWWPWWWCLESFLWCLSSTLGLSFSS